MKCQFLLLLVFFANVFTELVHAQDESGPSYKVTEMAKSGPWTISKIKPQGKPFYGMMSRNYQDGRMFRYFGSKEVSAIMVYDPDALRAIPNGSDSAQGTLTFAKATGDSEAFKVWVSTANDLTSEQDAVVTVNVISIPYFLVGVADSEAIVLKINGYTGRFNLKGSTEAAKELVKLAGSWH